MFGTAEALCAWASLPRSPARFGPTGFRVGVSCVSPFKAVKKSHQLGNFLSPAWETPLTELDRISPNHYHYTSSHNSRHNSKSTWQTTKSFWCKFTHLQSNLYWSVQYEPPFSSLFCKPGMLHISWPEDHYQHFSGFKWPIVIYLLWFVLPT